MAYNSKLFGWSSDEKNIFDPTFPYSADLVPLASLSALESYDLGYLVEWDSGNSNWKPFNYEATTLASLVALIYDYNSVTDASNANVIFTGKYNRAEAKYYIAGADGNGYTVTATASVTADETTVTLSQAETKFAVGDIVEINSIKRKIVSITSSTVFEVNEAFSGSDITAQAIVGFGWRSVDSAAAYNDLRVRDLYKVDMIKV